MRLPSLVKLPRYKQFNYKPRFYDPIKEELQERVKLIEESIQFEKEGNTEKLVENYAVRMAHSFRNRQRPTTSFSSSTGTLLIRLTIMFCLMLFFFTYYQYGQVGLNTVLMIFFVAVLAVFLVFRKRRRN